MKQRGCAGRVGGGPSCPTRASDLHALRTTELLDANLMNTHNGATDRTQQAMEYITTCCRNIGSFSGTGEVNCLIEEVASEMEGTSDSDAFPERYIKHVAYAMRMVARNGFKSSPAAVASVYLATRFEFYFRILSGVLDRDGTWTCDEAQDSSIAAIDDSRLKSKRGHKRISSVGLAYKIMKLNKTLPLVRWCIELDDRLYPKPVTMPDGKPVGDIGERIESGRNAAGHGRWGDISAEALFYGLMTVIVFYNQT